MISAIRQPRAVNVSTRDAASSEPASAAGEEPWREDPLAVEVRSVTIAMFDSVLLAPERLGPVTTPRASVLTTSRCSRSVQASTQQWPVSSMGPRSSERRAHGSHTWCTVEDGKCARSPLTGPA